MGMNGEVILNDLKQGVISNVHVSVRDHLNPALKEPCDLTAQNLTNYGFFAAKFLHCSVGQFDKISSANIPHLISAIHTCYLCIKRHRPLVKLKDPMAIQNLLYHIISKIQGKGYADEVMKFADFLYEEICDPPLEFEKVVSTLSSNVFRLLWNFAIKLDKDISCILNTVKLRHHSIKFAIQGNREISVIAERALSTLTAFEATVNRTKVDSKTISACHEVMDDLLNVLKAKLLQPTLSQKAEISTQYYVDINLHYCRYLARNSHVTHSKNILNSLHSCSEDVNSKSSAKSGPVLKCLRLCIMVTQTALVLPQELLSATKGTLNSSSILSFPDTLVKSNGGVIQLLPYIKSSPGLLQMMVDSYLFLKSQQDSFLKSHKDKASWLPLKMYDILINSLDVLVKLYQAQQENMKKSAADDQKAAKAVQTAAKREIDTRCNRLCLLLDKAERQEVKESSSLLPYIMLCQEELHCVIGLLDNKDNINLVSSQERHIVGWLGQMFGRICFENSLFDQAVSFFKCACQQLSLWCDAVTESNKESKVKVQLWRRHEDLIECYRRLGLYEEALDTVTVGLRRDASNLNAVAECWARIKKDIARKDPDSHILKRTLRSSVTEDRDHAQVMKLLRLEFQAYKTRSRMHSEQLAVLEDLLEMSGDEAVNRAVTLTDMAQVKWTHSVTLSLQVDGSAEAREAMKLLQPLLERDSSTLIRSSYARACLWFYITTQKNTNQSTQQKEADKQITMETNPAPSTPTSDDEDDGAQDELCTVSMETESMQPLGRCLQIYEELVQRGASVANTSDLSAIIESLAILTDILWVANKPLESYRCTCVLMNLSSLDLPHYMTQHLAAATRQIKSLIELQQLDAAQHTVEHVDQQLVELGKAPPVQPYVLYLLAKAKLMYHTSQTEKMYSLIREAQILKDANFKQKTKDSCLLDGSIQRLQSVLFMHNAGSDKQRDESGRTDMYPLDMAFDAFRWHTGVINHLIGRVFVTKEGMDLSPKDNSIEKWHAVDEVLSSLLHIGQLYYHIGDEREAKAYLKEGLHITRYFNLPRRCAEFQLAIIKLTNISGKFGESQAVLNKMKFLLASNEPTDSDEDEAEATKSPRHDCFGFSSDDNDDNFIKSKPISMRDHLSVQNVGSPVLQCHTPKLPAFISHKDACDCARCQDVPLHQLYIKYFTVQAECLVYQSLQGQANEFASLALDIYKVMSTRAESVIRKVVSIAGSGDGENNKACPVLEQELMDVLVCLIQVNLNSDKELYDQYVTLAQQRLGQNSAAVRAYGHLRSFLLYAQVVPRLPCIQNLPSSSQQEDVSELCDAVNAMTVTDKKHSQFYSESKNDEKVHQVNNSSKEDGAVNKRTSVTANRRKYGSAELYKQTDNISNSVGGSGKNKKKSIEKTASQTPVFDLTRCTPDFHCSEGPDSSAGVNRMKKNLSSEKLESQSVLYSTPGLPQHTPRVTTEARVYHGIKNPRPDSSKLIGEMVTPARSAGRGGGNSAQFKLPASTVKSKKAVKTLGTLVVDSDNEEEIVTTNKREKSGARVSKTGVKTRKTKNSPDDVSNLPSVANVTKSTGVISRRNNFKRENIAAQKKPVSSLFVAAVLKSQENNTSGNISDAYEFKCSDSEVTPKAKNGKKKVKQTIKGKKTKIPSKKAVVAEELDTESVRKADLILPARSLIENGDVYDINNLSDEENIPPPLSNLSKCQTSKIAPAPSGSENKKSVTKVTQKSNNKAAVRQSAISAVTEKKPLRLTRARAGATEKGRDSDADQSPLRPLDVSLCLADDESDDDVCENTNNNLESDGLDYGNHNEGIAAFDEVIHIKPNMLPEVEKIDEPSQQLDDSIEICRAGSDVESETKVNKKTRNTRTAKGKKSAPVTVKSKSSSEPSCEELRGCSESDEDEGKIIIRRRGRKPQNRQREVTTRQREAGKEECELVRSTKLKKMETSSLAKRKKITMETEQIQVSTENAEPNVCNQLESAFSLISSFPSAVLYRVLCQALALCHLGSANKLAAFYLTEATAVTFRHNMLDTVGKRLRKLNRPETTSKSANSTDKLSEAMTGLTLDHKHDTNQLRHSRQTMSFNKSMSDLDDCINCIPEGWTVCQVSVVNPAEPLQAPNPGAGHMVITRFRQGEEPYVLPLPGFHKKANSLLEKFNYIMTESKSNMQVTDKLHWWSVRTELNHSLKECIEAMEQEWLAAWRAVLLGRPHNKQDQQKFSSAVKTLHKMCVDDLNCPEVDQQTLGILLDSFHLFGEEKFARVVSTATGLTAGCKAHEQLKAAITRLAKQLNLAVSKRQPVILILDKCIQQLPWECLSILKHQPVSRMPSLYYLKSQLHMAQHRAVWTRGVNPAHTYYILNPDNNLPHTQEKFQDSFSKETGWTGLICQVPTQEQFTSALTDYDLFVYCGHGSGSKYLPGDSLQTLDCRAAVLLMGCSSGRLTANGHLEAAGMMKYYWLAGCPSIAGNLWDVTDKDIDRFLENLLKEWLTSENGTSLLTTVPVSREACRLQYLIGASPVVYGLPVTLSR